MIFKNIISFFKNSIIHCAPAHFIKGDNIIIEMRYGVMYYVSVYEVIMHESGWIYNVIDTIGRQMEIRYFPNMPIKELVKIKHYSVQTDDILEVNADFDIVY